MQTAKFTDMPQGSPLSELHKLSEEHSLYDRMLETLRAKPMPTEQEMLEEVRLKKMKLRLKDEMELLRRQGSYSR
jgi:uncharacterized protein YdcH (DUF465 family)